VFRVSRSRNPTEDNDGVGAKQIDIARPSSSPALKLNLIHLYQIEKPIKHLLFFCIEYSIELYQNTEISKAKSFITIEFCDLYKLFLLTILDFT
jgi:hypothetical protein